MPAKTKERTVAARVPAASLPVQDGFSLISNDKLLALYAAMLKCRMLSERLRILFTQNDLFGNVYLGTGREAVTVGVATDLLPEDTIVSAPLDFLASFIKGVPLAQIFTSLYTCSVSPGKAHPAPAGPNIATATALANKTDKNNKIAVAFSGDGLASWHDAMQVAGARELPMIFVCQTSFQTEPLNMNAQAGGAEELPLHAQDYGFPAIPVDGNDVVAVYRVAIESIAHARRSHVPTLIECKRWNAGDPILNMESYLIGKGLFTEEFKRQVSTGFSKELDSAIEMVEKQHSSAAFFHPSIRTNLMIE